MMRNAEKLKERTFSKQEILGIFTDWFPVKEIPIYGRPSSLSSFNYENMETVGDNSSKKNETKNDVDESALENFITKILMNQMIALAEGEDIYDSYESNIVYSNQKPDGTPRKRMSKYTDTKLFRQKPKSLKKSKVKLTQEEEFKESVLREMPNGTEVKIVDGEAMVTFPVEMLRQYICHDVQRRVHNLQRHYEDQWETISKERMARMAELFQVRETVKKLEEELAAVKQEVKIYKCKVDDLGSKVNTVKEAKKRRRQAKKQRRLEESTSEGIAEEESCEGEAGGDNNANNCHKIICDIEN